MGRASFLIIALLIFVWSPRRAAADPFRFEDPIELRGRGQGKKRTGVALMVLGSLNLGLSVASLISVTSICAPRGADDSGLRCEFFDAAMYSTSLGSGLVAAHLLFAGIPIYLAGVRQSARAERLRSQPRAVNVEHDAVGLLTRREQALRHRAIGVGLLAAGAASLGLGVATLGVMGACLGQLRCPGEANLALIVLTPVLGASGITLLSVGAPYYRRSRRELRQAGALRALIGPTMGLAGTF